MLGVTIPPADTYGYLDESEAPGVILEDEAQGLYRDLDKAKIYKAGYKQGAVVPRTIITQNKRQIKYFRVFCFKACAAEEMPRVKGLLERFIFIPMAEGYPRKDWPDLNRQDEERLRQLRNILLKTRMATRDSELPDVELPAKGRLKELWKPIIQTVTGLTVEKDLRAQIEQQDKERLNEKTNTLTGHIVKTVTELYTPNQLILFADIWQALAQEIEGKLDDNKPNKMDTPEFGEITKQKVGYTLREALGGKKEKLNKNRERAYSFDHEKLKRIAKKYGVTLDRDKRDKETTPKGTLDDGLEKINQYKISETEKQNQTKENPPAHALPQVVQTSRLSRQNANLDELAAKAKEVVPLTTDFGINECVGCFDRCRSGWQINCFDDSWGYLCLECGHQVIERMKKETQPT
jgi:hypothetical protein